MWKGLVTFGLVNIPVELRPASRDHRPRFRLLHGTDMSPISMERVCQTDGKPVAWADLVKGYEIEPGRFVAVTEDDFKTAALERSRSIHILAFVPVAAIDARYWDTPYQAVPGNGAEHSCALLAQALEKSGRVGIAKYVMRERQHLAALTAVDGGLVLATMRFAADLVALPARPARGKGHGRELDLAMRLIESMAEPWTPDRYSDDYVPALMKVIEAKARGTPVSAPRSRPAPATSVDSLMARLRESLAAAERPAGRAPTPRPTPRAAKKRPSGVRPKAVRSRKRAA